MTYKIKCNDCGKTHSYPTEEADSYLDDNGIVIYFWSCKECHAVVEIEASWIRKK